MLRIFENYTFSHAAHINLISEGFRPYFNKYKIPSFSYFTNGIDLEFMNFPKSEDSSDGEYIITYAGNIGEGQGLQKIIPEASRILGKNYKFRIIGDGGKKKDLIEQLARNNAGTVELLSPVSRNEVLEYYNKTHFLFLHLNDYKAFEKVLPSKIFEYGATDKPIIAGVSGFAARFIEDNLTNYILFPPGNAEDFASQLKNYKFHFQERNDFKEKFARSNIDKKMVRSILNCVISC
jgi:glycosyltransferase involved in cell wall biosynthesis